MNHDATMQSVKSVEEALVVVFQNNFDSDSKICLVTLMKMLDNVLHQPSNEKVRSIRLSNAAFQKKVGSRKGAIEFLMACGFARNTAPAPLLSMGDAAVGEETLVLTPDREDQSHLIVARRLLMMRAVQDLGMKAEELPPYRPPPTLTTSTQSSSDAAAAQQQQRQQQPSTVAFDPYRVHHYDGKSAAVGADLRPDPNYVSPTEQQLQKLLKQQAELEAELHSPLQQDREWGAFLPTESVVTTPLEEVNSAAASSDSALIASMMKKQQEERSKRENRGLTTKAMRDLEKMKNQKVYSHVTLTIQFADGCKLVGKFLPKEKVEDVQQALMECFVEPDALQFDLYVTPPRRLLPAKRTLTSEGLVPAAKIFVSWKGGSSSFVSERPLGTYMKASLFSAQAAASFPSSKPIDGRQDKKPEAKKKAGSADKGSTSREDALLRRMMGGMKGGLGTGGGSKKPPQDDSKPSGGGNKPKWFK